MVQYLALDIQPEQGTEPPSSVDDPLYLLSIDLRYCKRTYYIIKGDMFGEIWTSVLLALLDCNEIGE